MEASRAAEQQRKANEVPLALAAPKTGPEKGLCWLAREAIASNVLLRRSDGLWCRCSL
jgi:hypothetical protein